MGEAGEGGGQREEKHVEEEVAEDDGEFESLPARAQYVPGANLGPLQALTPLILRIPFQAGTVTIPM